MSERVSSATNHSQCFSSADERDDEGSSEPLSNARGALVIPALSETVEDLGLLGSSGGPAPVNMVLPVGVEPQSEAVMPILSGFCQQNTSAATFVSMQVVDLPMLPPQLVVDLAPG